MVTITVKRFDEEQTVEVSLNDITLGRLYGELWACEDVRNLVANAFAAGARMATSAVRNESFRVEEALKVDQTALHQLNVTWAPGP